MQKLDNTLALFFLIPLLLDRYTKYLVTSNIWYSQEICSFFNIYITHNRGIAWSIADQMESAHVSWLTVIIACILVYFAWYLKSVSHHRSMTKACLLIISGGFSNFFDRLCYGSVIDFLQFHWGSWYFPVFNIADASITLGGIWLLYCVLFDESA